MTIEELAAETAYSLGIPLYIRDGDKIFSSPPGIRVDPRAGAVPSPSIDVPITEEKKPDA